MTQSVGVVIRCADQTRHVYATLDSVRKQTVPAAEIILVVDDSTASAAVDWVDAMTRLYDLRIVRSATSLPGAVRNAGIRGISSDFVACVDAGDLLAPRYLEIAQSAIAERRDTGIVTTWMSLPGLNSTRTCGPAAVDLEVLIGDSEAIHNASIFRRNVWAGVGGFDESLETLESYEFWLKVLAAGHRCAVVQQALITRPVRRDALYRHGWRQESRCRAMQQIVERHAVVFAARAAAALCARDQAIREISDEYQHRNNRRLSALAELDSLKDRLSELRQHLPESERDRVAFGDVRRTSPISRDWGYRRGQPVDRRYIERFLESHADDIRGVVLEVQEEEYSRRFGGNRVTRVDVVDVNPANAAATIVSDLRAPANIPAATYDCIILTQTLHVIDGMRRVVDECARLLKPGGVLLATLPSASRVCVEYGYDGDFWRVTEAGARTLFSSAFPEQNLEIASCGNVLTNAAFLYGLASHELTDTEFEIGDPYFPLLVTVRAQRSDAGVATPTSTGSHNTRGAAVLLYHRVDGTANDAYRMSVTADEFQEQMRHVLERYQPMRLSDLVAAAAGGTIPVGGVAVTFDDGYLDNLVVASPVLTQLKIPATFFLTTDTFNEPYEYWWDALERMVLTPDRPVPKVLRLNLADGPHEFATDSSNGRSIAHRAIYSAMVGATKAVRDDMLARLVQWAGPPFPMRSAAARLRRDDILMLAAKPEHDVGAHSVNHLALSRHPASVQFDEVAGSRTALESLLQRPVDAFAYPFGDFNDETVRVVGEAGFRTAVTCEPEAIHRRVDLLRIPRLDVAACGGAAFDEWLARAMSSVEQLHVG